MSFLCAFILLHFLDRPLRPVIPGNVTLDGSLKEVNCTVHTNKPSTIVWYKINDESERTELSSNLTMNILPLNVVSPGKYACQAKNEYGSSEALLTIFSTSLSKTGRLLFLFNAIGN